MKIIEQGQLPEKQGFGGSEMMPTMELRWLEKEIMIEELAYGGDYYRTYTQTVKVLQQLWIEEVPRIVDFTLPPKCTPSHEWRDIPTEKL